MPFQAPFLMRCLPAQAGRVDEWTGASQAVQTLRSAALTSTRQACVDDFGACHCNCSALTTTISSLMPIFHIGCRFGWLNAPWLGSSHSNSALSLKSR